jgi:hypothetical protein
MKTVCAHSLVCAFLTLRARAGHDKLKIAMERGEVDVTQWMHQRLVWIDPLPSKASMDRSAFYTVDASKARYSKTTSQYCSNTSEEILGEPQSEALWALST